MSNKLLKSAFFVMLLTLVGRSMGLIRNMFITHQFGTTIDASAYLLAFSIPNTLFMVLPGVMNAIFIPALKGLVTNNNIVQAQVLFHKILTITLVIYAIIGLGCWIFAGPIIDLIASGASIELKALATELLRWMLPSTIFIALIGLFSSTLNVHYYFVLPQLGTIANSLVVILSIYFFVPVYGVVGLAIGTMLGFAAAAFIMLPALMKEKYSLRLNWQWRDPEIYKMGMLSIPILIGSSVTSLIDFLEKFFVSGYGDDKIAALGYAKTVYQLPLAIFFGALAMPIFILMLDYIKQGNLGSARDTIEKGLRYLMIVLIPTTIGLAILGEGIVAALYQRGEFDQTSTQLTTYALIFYSIGLYPFAVRDLLTRAFYSLDNTLSPVLVGLLQILLFFLFTLGFLSRFGFAAVALGWSTASIVTAIVQSILLSKKIGNFITRNFLNTSLKVVLSTVVMGVLLLLYQSLANDWNLYIMVGVGIVIASALYFVLLVILKEGLAIELVSRMRKKVLKENV